MNRISISNTVLPVVTSAGFITASAPFYHADRIVDFNIMFYVTKGVIYVTEEDIDFTVGIGELLFLKRGVHHFGKYEIPKGTEWFYAHFYCNEQALPEYFPDSMPIVRYENLCYSKPLPKKLNGLCGSELEKRIYAFSEYYNSNDEMNVWYSGVKFLEVLTEAAFMNEVCSETLSDKIAGYLRENFAEPYDTRRLSGQFFLSYKRLAAIFKAEKGMSMQQYHNTVRMNEACRLLSSTLMPVVEIAAYVGFNDTLYFSRCFKAFTGTCPTEYREKHRKYY